MSDLEVLTTAGMIRGSRGDGTRRFLGVPYAAAPVGARRFALPVPPDPWPGTLDAVAQGPTAPQSHTPVPGLDTDALVGPGWRRGDSYLNVNVWAPDTATWPVPVMVYIHGGAFVLGGNDAPVHDGSAFARSGVVCVVMNYRLGIDGFLPIPGVPTNLGLRDQIAALAWVRENAAAFGGDPSNVTIFGESAGAMSVANLLASPLAKGLFRRAIVQSGHGSMVRPLPVAGRLTRRLARILKVSPDIDGFRTCSAERCVDAVDQVSKPGLFAIDLRDETGREPAFGLSRFLPIYGDDVLPEPPLAALRGGAGAEVDLLVGSNSEEMNLYMVPTGAGGKLNAALAWYSLARVQPGALSILRAYGLSKRGTSAGQVFTRAMTDLVFRLPARAFAASHRGRTHFYEFGWRSPRFGGQLGACHAIELPFVFDTLATCTGPLGLAGDSPPQWLADRAHRIWVDFAKDGSLPWQEYEPAGRQLFSIETATASSDPAMPAEMLMSHAG